MENTFDFEIVFNTSGIRITGNKYESDKYILYNSELCKEELRNRLHYKFSTNLDHYIQSDCLLGVKVQAKNTDYAIKSAISDCNKFDFVLNFIYFDKYNSGGVIYYNFTNDHHFFILSSDKTKTGSSSFNDGYISPIYITQNPFKSDSNAKIWDLLIKNELSELENRILDAIIWIGKALLDSSSSRSITQYFFAIERILKIDDNFISPSISYQISENMAFILGKDINSRKNIIQEIKRLYQIRSSITHGSDMKKKEEMDNNIDKLRDFSKRLIYALLHDAPYCKFNSLKELNNYLLELKFK